MIFEILKGFLLQNFLADYGLKWVGGKSETNESPYSDLDEEDFNSRLNKSPQNYQPLSKLNSESI